MLIVLTGKTASGKDTVMAKLLEKLPNFQRIITTTSRPARAGEKDGIDYNFISKEEFERKINNGDFIEYVEYGGNLYGTEKNQLDLGENLIWRTDPSWAGKIKNVIKDRKILVIYLTVSDEVVLKRLQERGLSQQETDKRMADDQDFWQKYKDNYNFVVENVPGKLDETLDRIMQIIKRAST